MNVRVHPSRFYHRSSSTLSHRGCWCHQTNRTRSSLDYRKLEYKEFIENRPFKAGNRYFRSKKRKSSVPLMCDSPDFVIRQRSKSFFFELEKSLTNMYSKISVCLTSPKLFCLVRGRRVFNTSWMAEISADKSCILLLSL